MEKVRKISHATIIGLIFVITLTLLEVISEFTPIQVTMPISFIKYYDWLLVTMALALTFYALFLIFPQSKKNFLFEGVAYLFTAIGLIEIATTIKSYPPLDGTAVLSGIIAIYYVAIGLRRIKYHHYIDRIRG